MKIKEVLMKRASGQCELCSSSHELSVYEVPPVESEGTDKSILLCSKCLELLNQTSQSDSNHFRCLSESMWSEYPAVQVVAYRILAGLTDSWAQNLLTELYLDDETMKWAQATLVTQDDLVVTKDSHGNILSNDDSVTLIKDLEVKGAGFTAKRGTIVRKISLTDNPEQIEGRVNGTQIVLLTKFLKKV